MQQAASGERRYQAFYCEENIWYLAQELGCEQAYVVFICNHAGAVFCWNQRGCPDQNTPIMWDYHVVFLKQKEHLWHIWDLDTALAQPSPLTEYMPNTFHVLSAQWKRFRPMFRVVEAQTYVERFSSDRKHMKNADSPGYMRPVPEWPPIYPSDHEANNLHRFCDPTDEYLGQVMNYRTLMKAFPENDRPQSATSNLQK
jgi:protein N-terminal glutamine amidohydrolase